jgi:AraC family transcriptional regulator
MSRQSQYAASLGRAASADAGSGLGACFTTNFSASDRSIVGVEERWRCPPLSTVDAATTDRILAGSWSWSEGGAAQREVSSVGDERFYTVGISLSATTLRFQHDGRVLCDGPVMPDHRAGRQRQGRVCSAVPRHASVRRAGPGVAAL